MYYHIYNRGAHKAPIFHESADYEHFLRLLYVKNDCRTPGLRTSEIREKDMFKYQRITLVDILAYCLMPNHFHLLIREEDNTGTATMLMHRLCTAYALYYNRKYGHSGTIFQGPYKAKYVETDMYHKTLLEYIHLNPYSLEKSGENPDVEGFTRSGYTKEAVEYAKQYEYSSFKDYLGEERVQRGILSIS